MNIHVAKHLRRGGALVACLALMLAAAVAKAEPQRYVLDAEKSAVGFSYDLQGTPTNGVMPVTRADLLIDVQDITASKIDVVLNPRKARAGFVIASEAMKSADVLSAKAYPEIRFQARRITGDLRGAQVTGDLTLRGVTRTATLEAKLYRQRGTEVGDLDHLSVYLTGALDRNAFGASGFSDLVGPTIELRILVQMDRAGRS